METGPGCLTAATGATITLKPAEQESKQNWGLKSDLLAAAKAAKHFVETALGKAPAIGKGIGPVL